MTSPAFHPAAPEELHAAITHIAEASPAAAARFVERTEAIIRLLVDHPDAGTPVGGSARRFPIRPFPYQLVYTPGPELRILAVAHERQKPEYWRARSQAG